MEGSVGSIHEARGTTNKLKQRQTPIIFHCAGLQALKVCDHSSLIGMMTNMTHAEKVIKKLEEYCNPLEKKVLQTYRLFNIIPPAFVVFLTELYSRMLFMQGTRLSFVSLVSCKNCYFVKRSLT